MHWVLTILVLLMSGCVASGNPSVRDEAVTGQIQIGVTTKEEVRKLLGRPNSVGKGSGNLAATTGLPAAPHAPLTLNSNYEVWGYSHVSIETNAATFIPVIGLFAGGATSSVSSVTIYFDDKGVVQFVQSSQSEAQSGMGSGVQKPTRNPQESHQESH